MAEHSVKVLCISTHKHPFNTAKIPSEVLKKTFMEAIEVDTRIKPLDAFLNLFSTNSYHIERFYSRDFELRLTEILEEGEFDVIHLESIFCTPYLNTIRSKSKAKVVLRAHNIEFEIWKQLANQEINPLRGWYLNLLAERLKTYEINVLNQVDAIIPITNDDKAEMAKIGVQVPMNVIPIGLDLKNIDAKSLESKSLALYHLGAMDWSPNVEGITWFIDEVWPLINSKFPAVSCSLAGRKMSPSLLSRSNGKLNIEGEVLSVSEFISDKNIAIIPLLSGGGMRVKIVEALAFGKVVITTSLGATGIPFDDGINMLIANTPNEFVEKIGILEANPSLISSIGAKARKLAETEFDLKSLSSKLTYFYSNL
jgi:glycosyltransferase involved in cell wall biosynthesis